MSRTMTRLLALTLVLVAAFVVGSRSETVTAAQPPPAARPNIVVVMTDDQTLESMRVMPNVRSLIGREGATFVNSFASFPLCCPSRATFVTGQYAHNHRILGNRPPRGGYEKLVPSQGHTLPVWLRNAGYRTVQVGKYLNGYGLQRPEEIPPGWDEWHAPVDPTTFRYFGFTQNENGRLVTYGSAARDYQTDVHTSLAVEAIRRLAPRTTPFFLNVAYIAPHNGIPNEPGDPANIATPMPAPRHKGRFASEPLPRPDSFNEINILDKPTVILTKPSITPELVAGIEVNYEQRLESLLAVDEGVAAIVRALGQTGELDNTYIFFTSDNGFYHGEHRIPIGKVLLYEPATRVPLLLRGPRIPRNVRVTQPVVNVDIPATIVSIAGARPTRTLDGTSLLPLVRNRDRWLGRDILLETPDYWGIRTPRYVFVVHRQGDRELYDFETDPQQLTSLDRRASFTKIRERLARRLQRLHSCKGVVCRLGPELKLTSRCADGLHVVAVRGKEAPQLTDVRWTYRGRALGASRSAPFRRTLPASEGLVIATATVDDGRRITLERTVRTCV
jgi:arylsulfatase A-like enzyme